MNWKWVFLLLTCVACAGGCSGSPPVETATTEPISAAAPTSTAEPAPVLIVQELEGFEPRSVVFANVEYTVTGVRPSNHELRSYAAGGEPVFDPENFYLYLDITALNQMTGSQAAGLSTEEFRLILVGSEFSSADEMSFLSDLTGLIPPNSAVDSFLAFPVPPGTELTDGLFIIGNPPDRRASLPLTGPVPEPRFPLQVELDGSAEGVGPTNGGIIVFTLLGATLSEDRPHEQANSPTGLRANEDELFLVVHVRAEKVSGRGADLLSHTGNGFRLLVDGVPRAPWDSAQHPSGSAGSPMV